MDDLISLVHFSLIRVKNHCDILICVEDISKNPSEELEKPLSILYVAVQGSPPTLWYRQAFSGQHHTFLARKNIRVLPS